MTIATITSSRFRFATSPMSVPAGSINSSVTDMARWLIVNSQKGKIDGRQIIERGVLADIHTPHMTTGAPQERPEIGPAGYGLGWGVDDYRGHRRAVPRRRNRRFLGDDDHLILKTSWGSSCCPT